MSFRSSPFHRKIEKLTLNHILITNVRTELTPLLNHVTDVRTEWTQNSVGVER